MEFKKTLDYVEVLEVDERSLQEFQTSLNQVKIMREGKIEKQMMEDFLDELEQSLEQVKQHQEGKIKLQSAREFLDELPGN